MYSDANTPKYEGTYYQYILTIVRIIIWGCKRGTVKLKVRHIPQILFIKKGMSWGYVWNDYASEVH